MHRFLALLFFVSLSSAKVILDTPAGVKKFPYVKYDRVWTGTPAEREDVAVPNVVITYGKGESKSVIAVASEVAYYLGQWTEDPGLTPRLVRKGRIPSIILPLDRAFATGRNMILLGTNNPVVKSLNITFRGPTLKAVQWKGRKVLIVGGRNPQEVVRAGRFLARRIIGFKAGAYRTFFSFVKLRGMIEKGEFDSALDLLMNPSGVSACGKNLSLAAPMVLRFPQEVKKVVKRRNEILYLKLVRALKERDQDGSRSLWKKAMITCYQCHQGLGIPRLRKFVPSETYHSKHQRIAKSWGMDCTSCHERVTEIRGY
jgi:hypothetical protein